jgi:hypothetical protein
MVKLVVESITPLTTQTPRNFRFNRARWLPSQGQL